MIEIRPEELPEPAVRTAKEMENVIAVRPLNMKSETPLYYMYRNLSKTDKDQEWLEQHHLRYDISRIPAGIINGEYNKTQGHYHPNNAAGVPYPEVYEVLEGYAYYLLQNHTLTDVTVLATRKGDIVFIPPGYGHVTINPGKTDLVMANLVSTEFTSEYDEIERYHGAAYYCMEKEGWIPNPDYGKPLNFHIRFPGAVPELGLNEGQTLADIIGTSATLDVLNHPEKYTKILDTLYT